NQVPAQTFACPMTAGNVPPQMYGYGMNASCYPYWGVGEMYCMPRRIIVTAATANLRRGPGTEYSLVTDVPRDTILPALGETSQWYRVQFPDGSQAWISKSLARMVQAPRCGHDEHGCGRYGMGSNHMADHCGTGINHGFDHCGMGIAPVMPGVPQLALGNQLPCQGMSCGMPGMVLPAEYRQAQLEQIAHQLRLTLAPAEIADLVKLLQR
ncbi:MAG TPA: SH3 domain-containing protein, partial [bacterium]|nr:SH3 domain-containing protein [bacterium]